ncbi:hypothetical protein HK101_003824 [Irineochytrium annulatum]|nr:hypothetical protein HK101_003824 [Irineochytrium annulatum]
MTMTSCTTAVDDVGCTSPDETVRTSSSSSAPAPPAPAPESVHSPPSPSPTPPPALDPVVSGTSSPDTVSPISVLPAQSDSPLLSLLDSVFDLTSLPPPDLSLDVDLLETACSLPMPLSGSIEKPPAPQSPNSYFENPLAAAVNSRGPSSTLPSLSQIAPSNANATMIQHRLNNGLLDFPMGISPSPLPTIEQTPNRFLASVSKLEMEPNIFEQSFSAGSGPSSSSFGQPPPPSFLATSSVFGYSASPKPVLPPLLTSAGRHPAGLNSSSTTSATLSAGANSSGAGCFSPASLLDRMDVFSRPLFSPRFYSSSIMAPPPPPSHHHQHHHVSASAASSAKHQDPESGQQDAPDAPAATALTAPLSTSSASSDSAIYVKNSPPTTIASLSASSRDPTPVHGANQTPPPATTSALTNLVVAAAAAATSNPLTEGPPLPHVKGGQNSMPPPANPGSGYAERIAQQQRRQPARGAAVAGGRKRRAGEAFEAADEDDVDMDGRGSEVWGRPPLHEREHTGRQETPPIIFKEESITIPVSMPGDRMDIQPSTQRQRLSPLHQFVRAKSPSSPYTERSSPRPSPRPTSSRSRPVGRSTNAGASRSASADGGTEEEKRKAFLEKNRQAALKCRQKKKAWVSELQQRVEHLTEENESLRDLTADLREEVLNLKALLLSNRHCKFIN